MALHKVALTLSSSFAGQSGESARTVFPNSWKGHGQTGRDLGLACLSGVLLFLCFPRFDLSALAWVALVPLLLALDQKVLSEAFLLSWVTGIVFFTGGFYWIWTVQAYNLLDYLLLQVLYLPQYVSLFGLAFIWIRRRTGLPQILIAPPLWVTLEYIRSHLSFLSLPWLLLAHSQYLHLSLIQITSLTGVYGLTFLIVLINAAIGEVICYVRQSSSQSITPWPFQISPLISLIVAIFLVIVTSLYGFFVLSEGIQGEQMTIALVQGNVSNEHRWEGLYRQAILDRYAGMTPRAPQPAPALIIWPETAVPGDVQHDPELQRKVGQVAIDAKTYILVGSAEYAKFTNRSLRSKDYNSMVLFSPEGKIEGQYRKMRLVPFGEYVPLRDYVKWPAAIASTMGDSLPGDEYTLFSVGRTTFGVVICWELIFPDLFREFVRRGASFMVIATNESWFGDTAAPYQLLAMSTLRAAENRVAIARDANTGVSAFIDPYGRILKRLKGQEEKELFIDGHLMSELPLSDARTFYTRYGDLFAFVQMGFVTFLMGLTWITGSVSTVIKASGRHMEA